MTIWSRLRTGLHWINHLPDLDLSQPISWRAAIVFVVVIILVRLVIASR